MNDMSQVIIPKSDQISSDDFLAGSKTYLIEEIEIRPGTEQPVSIFMAGEPRAWKPCKSMSRCLVAAWGPDANVYKGRSVTLYRDPKVKWGGMEVGGIRISHMSHIERDMLLQLTATKGKRAPHVVQPLIEAQSNGQTNDAAGKWANQYIAKVNTMGSIEALNEFANSKAGRLADLEGALPNAYRQCIAALDAKRKALAPQGGFGDDLGDNPNANHGERFTDDGAPDVREAKADEIRQMIANAETPADLETASSELDAHGDMLPDVTAESLAEALRNKRIELGA